jgi:hypothetical protein
MDTFNYQSKGQTYRITPFDDFEPRRGDYTGLAFKVETEIINATAFIKISRTLEAMWGITTREELRNALIQLGNLKISEAVERGQELEYFEFMFLSSDPIIGDTLDLTIQNLQRELNEISSLNLSQTYIQKKLQLNSIISEVFGIYDDIDETVTKKTGESVFTSAILGTVHSNLVEQEIRTKEEYHWALMLTSLPFEAMDFHKLDPNFPTEEEIRTVKEGLNALAGEKEEYYYVETIKSLAQVGKLIRELEGENTQYVNIVKAVHGLRNTYPTHSNQRYIGHRRRLGLSTTPPESSGENETAYIDEMITIYENLKEALKNIRDKTKILAA